MGASGQARWFERVLAELQFESWIGDAAEAGQCFTQPLAFSVPHPGEEPAGRNV
jgi:hypothetical protein